MTLLVGVLLYQPHPGRLALVNWTPQERSHHCAFSRQVDRLPSPQEPRHSVCMSAQAPKPRFSLRAGASSGSASVGAPSATLPVGLGKMR